MLGFFKRLIGSKKVVKEEIKVNLTTEVEQKNSENIKEALPTDNIDDENGYRVAPISTDPTERGDDKEFRLPSDNQNVIRINQEQPKGFPKKVAELVPVVGITMDNRLDSVMEFIKGTERRIELQKEPFNKYDKNAIAVYGHWLCEGVARSDKLGYIPRDIAAKLSKLDDVKATLKMMFTPIHHEEAVGIRIDVWSERKKKEKLTDKPYKEITIPNDPVKRNLIGQELEKEGYVDNAIELYELNVKSRFTGSFPYNRLAIIYRKRRQTEDEVRVLEQAVDVFEELDKSSPRQDVNPKLLKFQERLEKARSMV